MVGSANFLGASRNKHFSALIMDFGIGSSLSSSLCFDRQDFAEKKFNAERFLVKCRLSGHPFEKIRDDLRVLLRIVQNSMIELINQRYADFVNLSSNLAGLSTTISKLKVDIDDCINDLNDVTTKICDAVSVLHRSNNEKAARLNEQKDLRRKIDFYEKLNRFDAILDTIHENKSLSNIFDNIPRLDYYILRILSAHSSQKDGLELETCLNCIFSKYQSILEEALIIEIKNVGQSPKSIENLHILLNCFASFQRLDAAHACFLNEFVDDCLLTYLLNILDEKFANLIFSTDPSAFKRAFSILEDFTRKVSTRGANGGLIRMIFHKFNVDVYYQLKKKEVLDNLNEIYANSSYKETVSNEKFNMKHGEQTFDIICLIWSENGVYLPSLASKCVELTFLVLNRLFNELIETRNSLQTSNVEWEKNVNSIIGQIDDFHLLQELLSRDIFQKIDQSSVHYNSIQSSLTCLKQNADNILQNDVAAWISEQISLKLDKVSEIPRRYRWTRKDAPETASAYIRESLRYLSYAYERCSSSKNMKCADFRPIFLQIQEKITENFAEKIRQVLNSVDKISSSLNRLKKGSAANFTKLAENGEENYVQQLSDEDKIRLQLKLDAEEYCQLLTKYDMKVDASFSENLLKINL
uniref:Conserved oligomeric Golgi complex subunit 2 n=1 Tax=Romanomermis culicivorax TaxID=13658 RepID=A0A915IAS2_ROMCU